MAKSVFAYIDESGDIGSRSHYIVFAAIITKHDRQLEKTVKKTWKARPQYHKKARLHATDVDDATRVRMLSKISELDITIRSHSFKKNTDTKKQQEQYYKELAIFIKNCGEAHIVVVERKDTAKKRAGFIAALGLNAQFKNTIFADPHEYKQLQAVDFVAWAHGRMLEQNDDSFYKIIEGKYIK